MRFELIVLGTSGALPAYGRNCSGHFLRTEKEDFLIDCGEATQHQLQRFGMGMGRVSYILISHLHGDHYFGLPGLITSLFLQSRSRPLTIISPPGLRDKLNPLLELDRHTPPFELNFVELTATAPDTRVKTQSKSVEVVAFPLRHRIPTNGYLIREKPRPANILKSKIEQYAIPYPAIPAIKSGGDFTTAGGKRIPHAELTTPSPAVRAYAYCSDTVYFPELAEYVKGVDLLYHEATFLEEHAEDAKEKGHSTAKQAAIIALHAGAKELLMGHYSARYPTVDRFETEAREVFENSHAARDGNRFVVKWRSR